MRAIHRATRRITRQAARRLRDICVSAAGSVVDFIPTAIANLQQWLVDSAQADDPFTEAINSVYYLRDYSTENTHLARQGRCALFDGSNDVADIGANTSIGTEFTFCFWLKAPTTTTLSINGVVSGTIYLFYRNGTAIYCRCDNGTTVVTAAHAQTTNWTHYAIVRSNTSLKIYVDGVLLKSSTITSAASVVRYFGAGAGTFTSISLRDNRIYSVAKDATEVAAIYEQSRNGGDTDAVGIWADWQFNEESGTIAYDRSGNGHHLTLSGPITESTFHATDTGITYNPNNELGHTPLIRGDGSTVYLSSPTLPSDMFVNDWTLDFVLDPSSTVSQYIVNRGVSAVIIAIYSGKLAVGTGTGWKETSTTLLPGRYTIKHDSSQTGFNRISMFRDGVALATTNNTLWTDFSSVGTVVEILRRTNASSYATSNIGNVRFWTQLKSDSEVVSRDANGLLFDLSTYNGSQAIDSSENGNHFTIYGSPAKVLIPAKLSDPTKDVLGNALTYTGKAGYHGLAYTQALTGDGSSVYVDLGSALVPATADFDFEFDYYRGSNGVISYILDQNSSARVFIDAANRMGVYNSSAYYYTDNNTVSANTWHRIRVARVGSDITTYVTVNGATYTASSTAGTFSTSLNTKLLTLVGSYDSGRVSNFEITTGGVTKSFHFPGPGSSNTCRDIYWIGSDNTYGKISNAVKNGTISTINANLCPGLSKELTCLYGGRVGSLGERVPATPDGSICADGGALDYTTERTALAPRIDFNPGTYAEFNGRNVPTNWVYGDSFGYAITPASSAFSGDGQIFLIYKTAQTDSLSEIQKYTGVVENNPP